MAGSGSNLHRADRCSSWGIDTHTDPRTVDVHINRLRDRFRENQDFEIITVRGIGYKAERKHEEG